MNNSIHPKLDVPMAMADGLIEVARELARLANAKITARRRHRRGATLRPGIDTPMWNALALAARGSLRKYGEKSQLGRILGVPPQRVHEFLMSRAAMPDAERTLLLLCWLAQRRTDGAVG